MRRNIKTFGPVLVAAFAMSALVASAAHATASITTTNNQYPVTLTGVEEGGTANNYFEGIPFWVNHCQTVTYQATLTAKSTNVTVTPHYTNCVTTNPEISATFDRNGCHFEIIGGAVVSATDSHAQLKLVCPPGKGISITVTTCTVHIPGNQTLGGAAGEVTMTSKPADASTPQPYLTIDVDITNKITFENTDGFLCPFEGNGTFHDGDFKSSIVVKAYDHSANTLHTTDTANDHVTQYNHTGVERGIHVGA